MNIQTCIHKLGLATLWRLPPEAAHNVAIWALQKGVVPRPKSPDTPELVSGKLQTKDLPGIGKLRHPICLAAGFDKNAETLGHLHTLGFAAAEVGTVTPRPQDGNSKPRLFRLREQRALINRMGFNNCGIQTFAQNLAKAKKSETIANIMKIGVNVGKNKLTPKDQAINDYIHCLDKTNGAADYYVVNISSPNTPGLRDLGTDSFLSELEERISPEQLQTTYIKIDPDRTKKSFSRLIEKIAESRFAGIILSNTSSTTYPQKGGLSGSPLLSASNRSLELAYEVHQGSIPTIASGGVLSGRDVLEKILRGASAVQIYTALVYRGADVVSVLLDELWEAMRNAGFTSLEEAQSALVK